MVMNKVFWDLLHSGEHSIERNEDLLPLRVANFRRLAEQYLMFVTDKDAVQDKFADGHVSQIPEAAVITYS